jgi:hypothetical protein
MVYSRNSLDFQALHGHHDTGSRQRDFAHHVVKRAHLRHENAPALSIRALPSPSSECDPWAPSGADLPLPHPTSKTVCL